MKAVTSDECVGMPDSGACSSCSSKFSPVPFRHHYAENMWVSDCDYVRKLIPPKDIEKAIQKLVDAMMNATTEVPQEELSPQEIFDESFRSIHHLFILLFLSRNCCIRIDSIINSFMQHIDCTPSLSLGSLFGQKVNRISNGAHQRPWWSFKVITHLIHWVRSLDYLSPLIWVR